MTADPHGDGVSLALRIDGPAVDLSGGLRLELVDPPAPRVIVSLVHSAYLRLVWHLGYEYVLEPSVQGLRHELDRAARRRMDDAELLARFGRYGYTMIRDARGEGWADLAILYHPSPLGSFAVFVPGIQRRAYTLFLPGFGRGARGLHERLRAATGLGVRVRQVAWDADREHRLAHPDARTWGREFWESAVAA